MKKILTYSSLFFLALVGITVSSCKKSFLEIVPKGKLIAKTTADYQLLLNDLRLRSLNIGFFDPLAQAPMGDEMAAVEPHFSAAFIRTQRLFRWDDVTYEPNEDAPELEATMKNIYLYNKVINEVVTSTGGTEADKRYIQAQALAARAWTYFLLINYYGKPYNATSSSTDPGFPIVTSADVTETVFTRAPVKEVYDFIISDLTRAIPNLPATFTHRLRMSRAAAEGILGKVYVYTGKYAEALHQFNAAFTNIGGAAIPVGLYDYNVAMGPGGSFLPIGDYGPEVPTGFDHKENLYFRQFGNYWAYFNPELVITPQTVALYAPSDLRLAFYSNTDYTGGDVYPAGMLRRIGSGDVLIGVVLPDLYLLSAECKARLNDLPAAKTDVEALRIKRMPAADAPVPDVVATNQKAMVKYILEERIREFAVLGERWFDMRRLSVDPVYSTTVGTKHIVYTATGSISAVYNLKPERLTLRFPQKLMDQNPGMQNNP